MKQLFSRLYNHSIKRFWIICCSGLCLLPILIGFIIYNQNLKTFHNQTVQNNEVMLMQIYDLLEEAFNDVRDSAYSLSSDEHLGLYRSANGTSKETTIKLKMLDWLKGNRNRSPYIREIGIYFPQNDEFITDSTTSPLPLSYYNTWQFTFHDQESFRDYLLSVKNQDLQLLKDETGKSTLVLIRKSALFSESIENPVILIQLDPDFLDNMINNVKNITFCELSLLLNSTKQYIYPVSESFEGLVEPEEDFAPTPIIKRNSHNSKDTFSYITSEYFNLSFVLRTPKTISGYETAKLNYFFLGGLLLILLGGLGLTAAFVRTNYKPIKDLLNLMADAGYLPTTSTLHSSANEYVILKEAMHSSQSHAHSLKEMLSLQEAQLKQSILALLTQNSAIAVQRVEYSETIKHLFPYEQSSIAILALSSEASDLINIAAFNTEDIFFTKEAISSHTEDIQSCVHILKYTGRIVLFLNIDKPDSTFAQTIINSYISSLCSKYPELQEKVIYSVSPFHNKGASTLSSAYLEADYALRYRLIFGSDFQPDNTTEIGVSLPAARSLYYPAEEEQRLLNAIISGDESLAETIFNDIWQVNTEKEKIAPEYLYFLLTNIVSTVIRTGNIVTQTGDISMHILQSSSSLMTEKSISKLKSSVLLLIREISKAYSLEHDHASESLKQRIYEYIDLNYSDPDLSVESISDVFVKSRTSLFLLFKNSTGNSLLYLINGVRVKHAKELLKSTDKPIQVIAQETGFHSTVTFTRVFKKHTTLPPGKYRDLNRF